MIALGPRARQVGSIAAAASGCYSSGLAVCCAGRELPAARARSSMVSL